MPGDGLEPSRKQRATSVVKNGSATTLHGRFLRALRNRAELTAEKLASELGYKRPTQVLRREAGVIGIPPSEIDAVARCLKCDRKLLQFARVIAFETPVYDDFGRSMSRELGASETLSPSDFFGQEIAAIEKDKSGGIWMGVSRLAAARS